MVMGGHKTYCGDYLTRHTNNKWYCTGNIVLYVNYTSIEVIQSYFEVKSNSLVE